MDGNWLSNLERRIPEKGASGLSQGALMRVDVRIVRRAAGPSAQSRG